MKDKLVSAGVSTLLTLLLLILTIYATETSARTLYDTCEEAGCEARNLSCCYDDGEDDDYGAGYYRKRRGINDAGYYCCNPLAFILGTSLGVGIPFVGCVGIIASIYIYAKCIYLCKKRKVGSQPITATSIPVSSNPPTVSRTDFQMKPVDTSSVHYSHTKSGVTMSFNLHPTTSTFKPDPVQQPTKQEAADDKFVANGPPSYSSLYS